MRSVKVDAIKLQDSIMKIQNLINSFEENELVLFSKIMSLKDIWNDGYSISFYEAIDNEKHEFDVLLEDLKTFNNTYEYIYKIISKYGNSLQADFNASHNVLSKYNSCNQKFYTIENMYDNLDLSRCSEVASEIHNQKDRLKSTQRNLDKYIEKYNDAIEDLSTMEYDVKSKVLDLDLRGITSITFSEEALSTERYDSQKVGMNSTGNIEDVIRNINISIQEEEDIISDINNTFMNLRNYYISNLNSKTFNNKHVDFNCQFKTLKNNHQNMVIFINRLKEKYLQLNNETLTNVPNDIRKVV